MADTTTIQYGGDNLALTPSETLVALPDVNQNQAVGAMAVPMDSEMAGIEEVIRLGPFRIVSVENAPQNAEAAVTGFNATATESSPAASNNNATRVYHTSDDGVPFVPSGEIYLKFEDDVAADWVNQLLQEYELEIVKEAGKGVVVRASKDTVQLCSQLQQIEGVTVAEPELITAGQLRQIPTDALLDEQWYLENSGQINGNSYGLVPGADSRVVAAWRKMGNAGSSNAVVAVIDDGFELGHPDLGPNNRIVAPFNFENNNTDVSPQVRGPNSINQPFGGDWHGTACAGVAIGRSDSGGVVGAAPNSRFMPLRWSPFITDNFIEKSFGHARDRGADVVSCSWGVKAAVFRLSTRMQDAIADCAQNGRGGRGCVICFAAGNSNRNINNPPFSLDGFAIHPNVIAVAASTSVDTRAHYSNFGGEISVCAPSSGNGGRRVLTSDVRGYYTFQGSQYFSGYAPSEFTKNGSAYLFGGTSSSCPLVAGVCALMLSADPTLTAVEVKQILESTARKIGDPGSYVKEHSIYYGYGCVDAEAALDAVLSRQSKKSIAATTPNREGSSKNSKHLVGSA